MCGIRFGNNQLVDKTISRFIERETRSVDDLEAVVVSLVDEEHIMAISSTMDRVRDEVQAICSDVNNFIDNVLLWDAIDNQERALIYKFKSDICG